MSDILRNYESDTPETCEAVERWQQGKINIFDEMARLERERDQWRECAERLAEAASDMQSGWFYIQEVHGRLSGIGWDRAAQSVEAALKEFERMKGETK